MQEVRQNNSSGGGDVCRDARSNVAKAVRNVLAAGAGLAALAQPAITWAQDAAPAAAEAAAPAKPDTGDTAWMLVSAALVLLMTPGLALFYGGMVRSKNILNMLMQSFIAIAVVSVLWVTIGYSLAFSPNNAFFGGMGYLGLKGVDQNTFTLNGTAYTFPHQVFMIFQLMFAIITPALISGAIAERMKFSAYIVFIALWSLLVYSPLAHMVWGEGGYLFGIGALDFAGGTVVHISSGISALVLAIMLGKRKLSPHEDARPHNLPMTLIGTGLLWFGWFGFNAGSAGASNGLAGSAFIVTHLAAAAAGLAWVLIEWMTIKKPTALGFATGAVAGLVAITPASGFVGPMSALLIGVVVSFVSYTAIKMKSKFGYDDTLDVFGVHCVGGIWGAIATGLFAQKAVNEFGQDGLFFGGGFTLLSRQFIAIAIALAVAALGTFIIASILKVVMGGIRVSANDEEAGLDLAQHGEEAYSDSPGGSAESTFPVGHGMTPAPAAATAVSMQPEAAR